jgi:hypothetical protein
LQAGDVQKGFGERTDELVTAQIAGLLNVKQHVLRCQVTNYHISDSLFVLAQLT